MTRMSYFERVIIMRVTTHNGRLNKHGVYSVKHNDRNFNVSKAKHIDSSRTCLNINANYYEDDNLTNEEAERKYYQENFSEWLNSQNKKDRKSVV